MRMHGDKIKGTELSSAFDAILQLEIKFIANVPLTILPAELVLHGKPSVRNHKGSVLKIARGGMHCVWAIMTAIAS